MHRLQLKGGGSKTPDSDWNRGRGGRSTSNSRQNSPPRETAPGVQPPRSRRGSRVARQHSYDDEVKIALAPVTSAADSGLGLPAPMPRRASAYDVYAVPGLSTVTAPTVVGRRPSFRVPPTEQTSPPSPETVPVTLVAPEEDRRTRRRGSQL